MKKRAISAVVVCFTLATACSKVPLSPPQMVGDRQADIAVQEFLYASKLLAKAYDLNFGYAKASDIKIEDSNPNKFLGFQLRDDIPYNVTLTVDEPTAAPPKDADGGRAYADKARDYYVYAGASASMLLCRNYLSGLRDRNEYFEYLQRQLGTAGGLATTTLSLVNANDAIRTPVELGLRNLGLVSVEYEKFRFLSPDIETLLPIVEAAQTKLRDHFLQNKPMTFAGALDAVSRIEYQCTRSGIRGLLNQTLTQRAPEFEVKNGVLSVKPSS